MHGPVFFSQPSLTKDGIEIRVKRAGNKRTKGTNMNEQAHEITDAAPTKLANLIGQQSVVDQVRVALDAAKEDEKKFDHALLCGPPGSGKTQTAKVIATEMASEFHEVLGQAITSPADLNAVLLAATDKAVIFIDEAHELDRGFQTALYLALDQRKVFLQGNRSGKNAAVNPAQRLHALAGDDR